jgi:hypothetical protein
MAASLLRKISVAARKREVTWRYLYNMAPSLAFRNGGSLLSDEGSNVLRKLNRDGIATTTVARLLGENSLFQELRDTVANIERERAAEIDTLRRNANDPDIGAKTFLLQFLGDRPKLDVNSIFARFALQKSILNIANSYFGMYTRLRDYNVWRTFVTSGEARESQLWHRDREDLLILKVFVYLNDIDDGAGPFTYAPGTHHKGTVRRTPESFDEKGVRRSTNDQMAAIVTPDRWVKATGPEGTIVFTDTHGYHKGGLARTKDRLMYLCMFTSPASESREWFERPAELTRFPDTALNVALAPSRRRFWLSLP